MTNHLNCIQIVYCGNKKVFEGILISLISLIKHTKNKICVHILTANFLELNQEYAEITQKQCQLLEKLLKTINPNSRVCRYDVRQYFAVRFTTVHDPLCTPYTLFRLLLDVIPKIPNKLIYLDTDTIINNDIQELWDIDINNYQVAVVRDVFRKSGYFNSGMMLINTKLVKQDNVFKKCCDSINKRCNYFFSDQNSLNKMITKKLMLPKKFNSLGKYNREIVVHHFCNVRTWWLHRIKPWEIEYVIKKIPVYKDIIDTYLTIKSSDEYKNAK